MSWSQEHDLLLCKEILLERPYLFKHGTRERGKCWDRIANNLNQIKQKRFIVDQRAVRDRYLRLQRLYKRRVCEENHSNAKIPEPTELDEILGDIIEKTEATHDHQEIYEEMQEKNAEREMEITLSARKRALEELTRERSEEDGPKTKKCSQERDDSDQDNSSQDLRVNDGKELELKMKEIELKKRELDIRERTLEIKQRKQEIREKEYAAKEAKDKDILLLLQQQIIQQQAVQQQLLDMMRKAMEKHF